MHNMYVCVRSLYLQIRNACKPKGNIVGIFNALRSAHAFFAEVITSMNVHKTYKQLTIKRCPATPSQQQQLRIGMLSCGMYVKTHKT